MLIADRGWEYFTEGRMLVKHPQLNEEELKRLRAKMWIDFFSPKKAAGVFRVPLYFYNTLKIPLIKVLKYMKACDYSVFGCILEDKFYEDLHYEMIDDYFGRALKEFEPEELDMTEKFDEFTNMLKLGRLKNILDNHDIVINISGGGNQVSASLCLKIRNKKIMIARVEPGPPKYYCGPCSYRDTVVLRAPLFLLKPAMAAGSHAVKAASVTLILLYNAVFSNFSFKFAKALFKRVSSHFFK